MHRLILEYEAVREVELARVLQHELMHWQNSMGVLEVETNPFWQTSGQKTVNDLLRLRCKGLLA